jgi:hypothetical protein
VEWRTINQFPKSFFSLTGWAANPTRVTSLTATRVCNPTLQPPPLSLPAPHIEGGGDFSPNLSPRATLLRCAIAPAKFQASPRCQHSDKLTSATSPLCATRARRLEHAALLPCCSGLPPVALTAALPATAAALLGQSCQLIMCLQRLMLPLPAACAA